MFGSILGTVFASFFNNFINTFIRELSWDTRVNIAFGLFAFGLYSFLKMIRKENDTHPIKVGWLIMCLLTVGLSVIYLKL